MATIILIVALLNILFATLLLVGTHKKCHKLVLSWVVYYGIILSKSRPIVNFLIISSNSAHLKNYRIMFTFTFLLCAHQVLGLPGSWSSVLFS